VWWALAAPILLLPPERRRRILVLGLGGGSVGHALRALAPQAEIVGVERDSQVLRMARRHFGLDRVGVELRAEDARHYLARERRRFDLVVEDLFVGSLRTVHKPPWLLDEGYRAVLRLLAPGGLVTSNTIHEMPAVRRVMRAFPGRVVSLEVRGHWNRILLCGRDVPPPRELRRRLEAHPMLARALGRLTVRAR
jgi:spermidine synthase